MIGKHPDGLLGEIVFSKVSHEVMRVTENGRAAQLAVLSMDGDVLAIGDAIAREVEAISVNAYRRFLEGKGWLRVISDPLKIELVLNKEIYE